MASKENRVFTIPNVLSMIRLLLIPIIVYLYCVKEEFIWTAVVLIISGLTDIVDGYIARHFQMVSNLGKALDPVADKLTQGVMLLCLVSRFPFIWVPLIILVIKELLNGVLHILVMKKTGIVYGAKWHGKLTTCMLYAMMFLHVIWGEIPMLVSNITVVLCIGMMICFMILYTGQNMKRMRTED